MLLLQRSSDPYKRGIGETYSALFRVASDRAIKADWHHRRFYLSNGHHRVEAAERQGLAVVPVQVRAENSEALREASAAARDNLVRSTNRPQVVSAIAAHHRLGTERTAEPDRDNRRRERSR